jgi:hypothetical protein
MSTTSRAHAYTLLQSYANCLWRLQPLPDRASHRTTVVYQTRDGVARSALALRTEGSPSSLLTGGVTAHGPFACAIIGEADDRSAAVSTAGVATAGVATETAALIGTTGATTTAGAAPSSAGDSRSSNNDTGVENREDPFGEPQGMLSLISHPNFVILHTHRAFLACIAVLLAFSM